jgi:hypothetical protein
MLRRKKLKYFIKIIGFPITKFSVLWKTLNGKCHLSVNIRVSLKFIYRQKLIDSLSIQHNYILS